MRFVIVGVVGVAVLCVAGCSSNAYKSSTRYPYGMKYPLKPVASAVAQPASTNTAKIVNLPASSSVSTAMPPASLPAVNISVPSSVPKSATTNIMNVPVTTVVITNIVSITNKTDVAPLPDVEVVNGQSRRPHLRFKDKAAEDGFLRIVGKKQSVLDDVRVIGKLYQEKNAQQQQFTASLQEQFAVKQDKNYQYDADTLTISEVVRPASGNAEAKTQLHMKLKDAASAQSFVRLAAAKRISLEQMANLQLMYREKQMEAAEYDRQLAAQFAIVKDRNYQYDAATKTLFELVKLPAGVEVPKAGGTAPVK